MLPCFVTEFIRTSQKLHRLLVFTWNVVWIKRYFACVAALSCVWRSWDGGAEMMELLDWYSRLLQLWRRWLRVGNASVVETMACRRQNFTDEGWKWWTVVSTWLFCGWFLMFFWDGDEENVRMMMKLFYLSQAFLLFRLLSLSANLSPFYSFLSNLMTSSPLAWLMEMDIYSNIWGGLVAFFKLKKVAPLLLCEVMFADTFLPLAKLLSFN